MQSAFAVLYCLPWAVNLQHIFPNYLINGTILRKQNREYKRRVLISSTNIVRKLLIIIRIHVDIVINLYLSSCEVSIIVRL